MHPRRLGAFLEEPGLIDNEHAVRCAKVLDDIRAQVISHRVGIPVASAQHPLDAARSALSQLLGQLPAVLPLNRRQQPSQVGHDSLAHFSAPNAVGNAPPHCGQRIPLNLGVSGHPVPPVSRPARYHTLPGMCHCSTRLVCGAKRARSVRIGYDTNDSPRLCIMITDRYAPVDLFALVPTLTREMDPELAALDQLVDDAMLIAEVKAAMSTRAPHSADRGTSSTPVEVVLRLLLVRRLYHWSYRQTAWFVDDSLSLRHFCRLYDQKAPDHSTLVRWAGVLGTTTIKALHERVVDLAIERGVTRGRKLRIDGTAVESTIHPPSDSSLLADAGRMLSRVLRRAKAVVGEGAPASLFRDWTRSTKRLARQISEAARKRSEDGKRLRATTYRRLLGIIGTVQRQAVQVGALLGDAGAAGDRLHHHLGTLLPVVEQVVQQTTRRLAGEQVPADEKIVV